VILWPPPGSTMPILMDKPAGHTGRPSACAAGKGQRPWLRLVGASLACTATRRRRPGNGGSRWHHFTAAFVRQNRGVGYAFVQGTRCSTPSTKRTRLPAMAHAVPHGRQAYGLGRFLQAGRALCLLAARHHRHGGLATKLTCGLRAVTPCRSSSQRWRRDWPRATVAASSPSDSRPFMCGPAQ
jgi:hypothetical protein